MEYEIIRSNRKTLAAQIWQGRLIIRAPQEATDVDIEHFINKRMQWIEAHIAESLARTEAVRNIPKLTPEELRALTEQALFSSFLSCSWAVPEIPH